MEAYKRLREILDSHPSTAPEAGAIYEILKILFTPQEAAVAMNMSFKMKEPAEIAQNAGLSQNETIKLLEAMANKGVIMSRRKEGEQLYGLVPLIPGLFEFPFMKGGGTPMHKRLGELWEEYHREALGMSFAGNPTPLTRVVAVDKSIPARDRILPYEDAKNFINEASVIALTNCACRISVNACDKPREVCLVFGKAAEFLIERGFARRISKEEGIAVLETAEREGLVHTTNNSADRANLICNCCPCCCTVLRGRTQLKHPHAFDPSRFEAFVQADKCTGCSTCIDDRCPMGAIKLEDNVAEVNTEECIGCGLCVTTCPAEAMVLVERKQVPSTPANIMEMSTKVLQEKGRLDAFMKIMKS
jgi:electron transport complex protein RnfB